MLYDDDIAPVLITCLNETPNLLSSAQWQDIFAGIASIHKPFRSKCASLLQPQFKALAEQAGHAAAHMNDPTSYTDAYFIWLKQCFGLQFMEANTALLLSIDSNLARQLFLSRTCRPLSEEAHQLGLERCTTRYLTLYLANSSVSDA